MLLFLVSKTLNFDKRNSQFKSNHYKTYLENKLEYIKLNKSKGENTVRQKKGDIFRL